MSQSVEILVVEDNSALRGQIVQILELEGYRVVEARNGREGLTAAQSKTPDLIVCDVSMPDMDGYQLLQSLRASESAGDVPFIFLSARVARNDIRAGMELGADDYLTKPFEAAELLRAVETRLRRKAEDQTRIERRVVNEQARMLLMLPHELRTPLNGILGAAEILKLDLEASSSLPGTTVAVEMVEMIRLSSLRLEQLATNLVLHLQLELAVKASDGAGVFRDASLTDLAACLRECALAEAERHGRAGDLQFGILPPTQVPFGSEFLSKALRELIDNAFKFSKPGTPVEIKGQIVPQGVEVAILDRGIGITQEEAAGMRPFQQWRRSQNEQQGLGLGFAIARNLASLNQSSLSLAPREGGGAQAQLSLPCQAS